MDAHLNEAASGTSLSVDSLQQLSESGFTIVPRTMSMERLSALSAVYDDAMSLGAGPGFRVGSTTTRLNDLVNHGPVFNEVYVHPPLLQACRLLLGDTFKLSSLLGRTLRSGSAAQELHVDLARNSPDSPLLGFILMIDPFTPDNGATRFVPRSQNWPDIQSDRLRDAQSSFPGEVLACGSAGSMIVFNGAVWHGHTANTTTEPRRSIQGYFVRRDARAGTDFSSRMRPETLRGISLPARYLLALE